MTTTKKNTKKNAKGRPEVLILNEIRGIYSSLSPENLSWDGERSMASQRKEAAKLNARLKVCFAELGREVPESEVFRY